MISRAALLFAIITLVFVVVGTSAIISASPLLRSTNPTVSRRLKNHQNQHHSFSSSKTLPAVFDWADHGFDLPIWGANSECGGLTVAAAVADAISGADFVTNKLSRPTRCSAAQLIDCFDIIDGCNGGRPDSTIEGIIHNSSGLVATATDYPWAPINERGGEGACRSDPSSWKACSNKVTGFEKLPNDEKLLQEILYREGPIMVVTSPAYIYNYTGGIVSGGECAFNGYEHMLLCTGWGVRYDNGKYVKYWRCRSDFGETWGEEGNVNLEFGVNCSGIAGWARQAKVAKHQ